MPKESVSLNVKRAFPFRIYGRSRPERTGVAQRFPLFADTEEVTGSKPCRAHHISLDQRKRFGLVTFGRQAA
jgi:hypothetical protein